MRCRPLPYRSTLKTCGRLRQHHGANEDVSAVAVRPHMSLHPRRAAASAVVELKIAIHGSELARYVHIGMAYASTAFYELIGPMFMADASGPCGSFRETPNGPSRRSKHDKIAVQATRGMKSHRRPPFRLSPSSFRGYEIEPPLNMSCCVLE